MDEKDVQTFSTTLAVEGGKNTAELAKEIGSDLIRPTTQSIGNNLGKLADGVFGWLGLWGEKQKIKQQQNLEKFKKNICSNIEKIPEENLKEPTMYIVGPAMEASKYYFEENYFREMFAKLIAGACDNRLSSTISPYFVDAIRQMTQQDAKILTTFKNTKQQPIVNYIYTFPNNMKKNNFMDLIFYTDSRNEGPETNASSILNLERLGFISIDFFNNLADDTVYEKYNNDPIFITIRDLTRESYNNIPNWPYNDLILEKGVVTLTSLGKKFINICL